MKKNLIAILACRNGGSRLYAKPLQNLDNKKKISIIQFIINNLKKKKIINKIGFAISKENENLIYKKIAKQNSIKYVLGDDKDVLKRLIKCGNFLKATDVLRITSESPFPFLRDLDQIWKNHKNHNYDATFYDNIIDGCGFEIINLKALKKSHKYGKNRHRSELCSLFIRENPGLFKIKKSHAKKKII